MSLQRAQEPSERIAAGAIYPLLTAAVRHQPRDISLTAASTLGTVERTGPRRITDLAVTEGVTQPSMTALVTVLERAGLAERRADPRGQRGGAGAPTPARGGHPRPPPRGPAAAPAPPVRQHPPPPGAAPP